MFGMTSQLYARHRTGRLVPRRLHQASLTSSLIFLGASAWSQRRTSRPAAIAHGTAFIVLSTLPSTTAGRPNHIGVAAASSVLHGTGVVVSRATARSSTPTDTGAPATEPPVAEAGGLPIVTVLDGLRDDGSS